MVSNALKDVTNAHILLNHHTGHVSKERERGASAIRCNVDTSMLFERNGDFGTLRCCKMKDDEFFKPIRVGFEPVTLEDVLIGGKPSRTLVTFAIEGEADPELVRCVRLAFSGGLLEMNQGELIKAVRSLWKGDAPGERKCRELLAEQVGTLLEKAVGPNNASVYKLKGKSNEGHSV